MAQTIKTPKAKKKLWAKKHRVTRRQLELMKKELKHRLSRLRPKLSAQVAAAAEFGDLPENASWDATTKEERQNELRIAELRDIVDRAEIVPESLSKAVADINDKLIIKIGEKEERVQLSPSHKAKGYKQLSIDSPIGSAIFGKKENFQAKISTPDGNKLIRIISIRKA